MSYVRNPTTGEWKQLTNLGWLLKNWQDVDSFSVHMPRTKMLRIGLTHFDLPEVEWQRQDCWLVAYMNDPRIYATTWASHEVLKDWLVRPVFMGLPITWFGVQTWIPSGKKGW